MSDRCYEFTLKFTLPEAGADPALHLDALFEAGCDDATVGVGKPGRIALAFDREAPSAREAVQSALADVQKAIPGASLIEAGPDFVNLADMAELLGCSRQNMRKYASGGAATQNRAFPPPVHGEATGFWHFYEVARWLSTHTSLRPRDELLEISKVTASLNLDLQRQRIASS